MKVHHLLTFVSPVVFSGILPAQVLVGPGSNYTSIYTPANTNVDSTLPPGLLGVGPGSLNSQNVGIWNFSADGGLKVSAVLESAARTRMTNSNSIEFRQTNSGVLGALGVGASLALDWNATANFDTPGVQLLVQPNTLYTVTFDVDANGGLLSSAANVSNSLRIDVLDGSSSIYAVGTGSLVDLLGLLGNNPAGTATFQFATGNTVAGSTLGLSFDGSSLIGANAIGIGDRFATFSNIGITAVPVPEPGAPVLLAASACLVLFRRRAGK